MPELGIGLGITKGAVPKTKLLLDKYDIDAAFSLRKVRADYNGPCVRVRNSSGDFADIGFTSSGVLDEAALNAHCGDNDGTVQTWYNQSTEGGRYNAVQDTADDQPIIYDASAGGYLGYIENTGNMYLRFENQLTGVTDTAIVYEHVTNTDHPFLLGAEDEDVNHGIVVNRNVQGVDGFALQAGSGQTISTHTGDTIGEKFASFIYTGGSDKFISVNGYVSGEGAVTDSIDLDLIFTRDVASGGSEDNNDFVGKIWEVFLSTSDLSDKRIQLENSILSANGLTVPEQTLLEKYDGAEGAFSTRCINREYVGPIIEVRAAQTTAVVEDVYLDSTGVVNKSRITDLCTDDEAGNALVTGYVKTWYDQSSFGYDVTNSTEAQQPIIHDATDGVVLLNGQPAVQFDGTNDILESSSQTINTEAMICVSSEDADGTGTIFRHAAAFIRYKGGATVEYRNTIELRDNTGNNVTEALGEATLTSWYTKGTDFNDSNASWKWYFNGELLGTKTGNNASSDSSTIKIGAQASSQELLNGKVCEAIIIDKRDAHYDSADQIHKDINAHYLIYQEATASPSSGFLADYSGAAAAYSVRQLGDANLCMRIRRDGDDAEKNIGFGSDGFVDTTAISDFCGSDDGFVVTWYDQSGNAVDATQDTPADQPKIYDGTDGIEKENGIPTINFDGTDDYLEVDGYIVELSQNSASVFVTANGGTPNNNTDYLLSEGDQASPYSSNFIFGGAATGGSGVVLWVNETSFGTITDGQHVIGFDYDGTNFQAHLDGGTAGSSGTATVNSETAGGGTHIGTRADGTTAFYDGNVQEIITYKSDKSSDRSDIEENINDAFNVHPDADTTPESGFLNEFSGAAAAYSVRKLGDSPVAMRVRKTVSSVDYYQIIGFDANGDLDTAAIEEFGGSNAVFVQTWYDQSGNGRHQVQDTAANQPRIFSSSSSSVESTNGRPALLFLSGNKHFTDSSSNDIDILGHSAHAVFNSGASTPREVVYGDTNPTPYTVFSSTIWNGDPGTDIVVSIDGGGANFDLDGPFTNQRTLSVLIPAEEGGFVSAQRDNDSVATDTNGVSITGDTSFTLGISNSTYNPFTGHYQELIIYQDGKSGEDRTNIQKNQNNYFLVHQEASASPATGLLSEAPNAAAAYSVRQLGDAKLCMKVRRGSDNATKNIGFKKGVVDTAAIEAFCGNSDGTVDTWYDQSGSGNHATQGTSANQPKIYDNATGIVTENDAAAVDFDGTNDYLQTTYDNANNYTAFWVQVPTSDVGGQVIGRGDSLLRHVAGWSSTTGPFMYRGGAESINLTPSPSQYIGYGLSQSSSGDCRVGYNGTTSASKTNIGTDTLEDMVIGAERSSSVFYGDSSIQEVVLYDSDQSSNRTTIETNINNHFKVYTPFTTGLLDSYPGAAAAYSLRRLSSTYTGPAIEVTSDGSTQDIGFDTEGNLDTSAIEAFCGSNDGTVSKWYDQSGNSNDTAQATAASQPKIYDGADGVVTENGKPAVEFDSSSYLSSEVIANTGEATAYVVSNSDDDSTSTKAIFFVPEVFAYQLNDDQKIQLYSGVTSEVPGGATTQIETNDTLVKNLIFFGNDGSTTFGGVNGQAFVTDANVPNSDSGYDKIKIGANVNNGINFDGKIQEAVYYNSDQRSVRAGIEKNVNAYYKVFDEPLLDVVPDAAAAYSLRKLRAGYTGPAINVYNGTDYKDIYFRSDGTLDTGAISRFCGSNDGTVAIWYDQSGNSNNASTASQSQQPKIYDGTNGLVTDNNGKPTTSQTADSLRLNTEISLKSDDPDRFLISFVAEITDGPDDGNAEYFSGQTAASFNFFRHDSANNRWNLRRTNEANTANVNSFFAEPASITEGEIASFALYAESDAIHLDLNGSELTSSGGTAWASDSDGMINFGEFSGTYDGNSQFSEGMYSEIIVWENHSDGDVKKVQANVNRYYSIY